MNGNKKKCAQCGKEMEALKSTKRYCSDACKQTAFYVRNANSHTSDNVSQRALNGIQERFITSMRIYCYPVTICTSALDSSPYYPEPINAINQQQPAKETELVSPVVTVCNKEKQFQTITSSGIYGSVKGRASYYHEEYKQVITVNELPWQDLRTNLRRYLLPSKKELNGQLKLGQRNNKHQTATGKRNLDVTPEAQPFTLTNSCHRIRDQTLNDHCLIMSY